VVFRDEGACGSGQQDQADPYGRGDPGQRGRRHRAAGIAAGEETKVWGDPAYQGQSEVIHPCAPRARDCTHRRYRYKDHVDEEERAKNRTKSKVRSKVEHVFGILKLKFGFVKVRYRGLAKNANRLFTSCALANLFMVRKKLLSVAV
jgi:IS5 family transposase